MRIQASASASAALRLARAESAAGTATGTAAATSGGPSVARSGRAGVHAAAVARRAAAFAFSQIARTGSESELAAAHEVLAQARRELYRILADGEDAPQSAGGTVDGEA